MTPRCTTIPPFARPTRPRKPWRRVARTSCLNAAPLANPPNVKAKSGANPSAPTKRDTTSVPMPHHAGQKRRWRKTSSDALRHGKTGAIDIMASMAIPIGFESWSKKGSPTTIWRFCNASMTSGKTVPNSTTNANSANKTLLARNAPSRETGESMLPGERKESPRQAMSHSETATMTPKKTMRYLPISLSLNA